ncbi:MAG: STAS domain-containing protein [Planctomycetia bacterium]|nr:STAS domain-containing protein [Planctomycetia bacterium]
MNLQTELFGNVLVVHTPDELSFEHTESFEACLAGLEARQIVLDVDHTESLDSGGLMSILNAQESLRERQGDLKIATTNAINRKILEITRLDQQLEVFESVVDAVNSFQ